MVETDQDRKLDIGALLRIGAPCLSPQRQRSGWGRLKGALDRRQGSTTHRQVVIALTACGVLGLVAVSARISSHKAGRREAAVGKPVPLSYVADRGEILSNGVIRNTDPLGAGVRFSDGSHVVLKKAARAQIVSVESRGARMTIADGEVVVNVVHRPSTRWRFDAGPFSVFVEGTSFSLGWAAIDERLDLRMDTGVVTVKGPLGADPIRVRAGETLTVSVPEQQIQIRRHESDRPLAPEQALAPPTAALAPPPAAISGHPPAPRAVATTRPISSGVDRSGWRDMVAAGRSADVVFEAETRGVSVTLARGGRDELAALADAARYRRRNDIAVRTLRALRDRFPSSDVARDAAFFLARLEETDDPLSLRALEWYRRYLTETPHGLYISDALGREMLIMQRLYGDDRARAIAREYLTRFPDGHMATRAAQITKP
jgi:TolA-binding protein